MAKNNNQASLIKGLSDNMVKAYLEAFKLMDEDGQYIITPEGYQEKMMAVGQEVEAKEFADLNAGNDIDGSPDVGFAEFLGTMAKNKNDSPDEVSFGFGIFDSDGNKSLSKENISETLGKFGIEMSDEEMEALFAEADKNNSGSISLSEFLKVIAHADNLINKKGLQEL